MKKIRATFIGSHEKFKKGKTYTLWVTPNTMGGFDISHDMLDDSISYRIIEFLDCWTNIKTKTK